MAIGKNVTDANDVPGWNPQNNAPLGYGSNLALNLGTTGPGQDSSEDPSPPVGRDPDFEPVLENPGYGTPGISWPQAVMLSGECATKVADTGNAGTGLINGTQIILSWTAPSDGNLHFVSWAMLQHVTSAETGGAVITSINDVYSFGNGFPGGSAAGWSGAGSNAVVPSGGTFELYQSTALTGGAATIFAQLWAA